MSSIDDSAFEFTAGLGKAAGFSLHAGVAARGEEREKLERVCRYVSRPAISEKRLSLTPGGKVCYELKTPYRDGSTHVAVLTLEPYGFMKYSLNSRCSLWSRASLRSTP